MNLVLDFGNTRVKAALFNGLELVETRVFNLENDFLKETELFSSVQNCLIASVTNNHKMVLEEFSKKFNTLLFTTAVKTPLTNLYKSALTLGSDRIAASVGAFTLFPNKNVLTIDAGTCIKYNFVNSNNEYLGGAISPGIPMRLKAMHHYTSALPLLEPDKNYDKLTGQSTEESILSGALIGAACEVDAMIDRYKAKHQNLEVVMTGGDSDYLCKQVKNRFFTNPNILLMGLNSILNYNLEK